MDLRSSSSMDAASSLFHPPFRKNVASMVSEPSILGRGRRLESQFEETMDGFERMATSLRELHREQEMFCHEQKAGWRRTDAKFDALKKLLLDLSFPSKGLTTTTTEENSGSCESQVREEEVRMDCNNGLDPVEYNLSPLHKTEELELYMPLPHRDSSSNGRESRLELPKFSGNVDSHKSTDID